MPTEITGPYADEIVVPCLVGAGQVPGRRVRWLWPGRIPLGKLTLLAGDPGRGKSLVGIDIAARVSTGRAWPDRLGEPAERGGVVLMNGEDDLFDTLKPRLTAAGADPTRVTLLAGMRDRTMDWDSRRPIDLSTDFKAVEYAVERTEECRLLVVDPLSAFLGETDSYREANVRALLRPLAELAQRRRIAVLAVTHLNKGDGRAIYRSMGSLAFTAAARAVWLVADDPEAPPRRLLHSVKNNMAPAGPGLGYRVVDGPRVAWEETPTGASADDVLSGSRGGAAHGATAEAAAWLREHLADGPQEARTIKAAAKADGIDARTLERAKVRLGVIAGKAGMVTGWTWRLKDWVPLLPPAASEAPPAEPAKEERAEA
jgi:hypothetical protein